MMTIDEIRQRLAGVSGKPWKYNPKHEMFVGTTHAVVMHDRIIDLGRGAKTWELYADATGDGWRITEASVKQLERTKALGEFVEHCREDMDYLIKIIDGLMSERPNEA